jgi:hypothetical protein
MNEHKVDQETAEAEFERFASFARIKMDRMRNTNTRRDLDEARQQFIEEVMDGRITVDEAGVATVHTDSDDIPDVRFGRSVTAMNLAAADKRKENEDVAKMNAMMGAATGIAPGRIAKLEAPDWFNVALVFGLFLAN